MLFALKHFDTELIKFSAEPQKSEPEYKILWKNETKQNLLPKDLELTEKGLEKWIKSRSIPKNRSFVDAFLAKCGLNSNRPLSILQISKGLSLNDCYWITEAGFTGNFDDYNLYDNNFSRILGQIAFTGYGSSVRMGFTSSPEFTTNGMLPKCWRRIKGNIVLYKGGTCGASNTGFEPYSEYYSWQVAKVLKIDAVPYAISKWKNTLCSTCSLFTSKENSFVPVGRIVKDGGFKAVFDFYTSLGEEFKKSIIDMIVLDAVIKNTDRHYGNFGFLLNSKTNEIIAPAPLFDHGNSLYNLAGLDDFETEEKLASYDKTLQPRVYDNFVNTAKEYMTNENKKNLRSALDFKLEKHSRYNINPKRFKAVENQIRKNIAELLK